MGTNLVNKLLLKSKFSENFINISWSPNQIFFAEFFFGKIQPILDPEKLLWNSEFWVFDKVVHDFGKPDEVVI